MFHIFVFVFQSLLNKNKDCPKHVFVFIIFSGLISDIAVLPTLCIDPFCKESHSLFNRLISLISMRLCVGIMCDS